MIAYGRGGVRETVIPDRTGLFFEEPRVAPLVEVVRKMERIHGSWDRAAIRSHAEQFSRERFQTAFAHLVRDSWRRFKQGEPIEPATPSSQ